MESLQQAAAEAAAQEAETKANDAVAAAAEAEERARKQAEDLERAKQEFEERQRKAEEATQRRVQELEKKAQKAAKEEEEHRQQEINMQMLEEQLMHVMPLVKEANLIAQELKKPHRIETKMQVEFGNSRINGSVRATAAVLRDGARLYEWEAETLENRVFLMRELLQRCEEEGFEVLDELANEEDPFWDPIEAERLIGVAQVLLEGLLAQVEIQLDARILSPEGSQAGVLRLELWPVAKDGTPGVPDDEAVDDPEELLGTRMEILLKVVTAAGLPEALANDVRVEYNYFIDENPYEVLAPKGKNCDPKFDYERRFVQDPVTSRFLEHLLSKSFAFRVYGRDAAAEALLLSAAAEASEAAKAVPSPDPSPAAPPAPPQGMVQVTSQGSAASAGPASPGPAPPGVVLDATPEPAPSAEAPLTSTSNPRVSAPSLGQVRREQEKAAAAMLAGAEPGRTDGARSKSCMLL